MTGRVARVAVAIGAVAVALSCSSDNDGPIVTPQDRTVTIAGGTGSGRVTSSPAGIDCRTVNGATSGTCTAPFSDRASVTLTAVPDQDQLFKAWTGDCTGSTGCQLSLTKSMSVSAGFVRKVETLSLEFRTTAADDGAAIIAITGPSITGVAPTSGLQATHRTRTTDGKTVLLIRGNLTNGVVASVSISGLDADKAFTATVEQVAARQSGNYAQRANLGTYSASVR